MNALSFAVLRREKRRLEVPSSAADRTTGIASG